MALGRRVETALREAGAQLSRDRKHLVYEFPNGRRLAISRTPSDRRAEDNILHDIRRVLQQEVRR